MYRFARIFAPALALIAGLLASYLLLLSLGMETVSYTFLIGFPAIASGVVLHFRPTGSLRTLIGSVVWLFAIMLGAIAASLVTGLEGMLCVAMATVPLLIGTLTGGVMYLVFLRWREETRGALKVVILPIALLAGLNAVQAPPTNHVISNSIMINAAPEEVFRMIKSIPDISPDEVETRLPHLLGIPKPTAAIWKTGEDGPKRHSYWGQNVRFTEVITGIEKNRRMSWNFEFPQGWAKDGIEDPHVKVGGRYFDILSGEYILEDIEGMTRLTLITRTYDNSGLGSYARFWHRLFFENFHEVILDVVKNRTEAGHGVQHATF
jgi:hypothetical protein